MWAAVRAFGHPFFRGWTASWAFGYGIFKYTPKPRRPTMITFFLEVNQVVYNAITKDALQSIDKICQQLDFKVNEGEVIYVGMDNEIPNNKFEIRTMDNETVLKLSIRNKTLLDLIYRYTH